jgi:AcrR family transcriptional regulator
MSTTTSPRKTADGGSAPRERLLHTASALFYREGIHAIGVDRLVAESGVTRATFYRHFPSKEDLVDAYLGLEDAALKAALAAAQSATDEPRRLLELIIEGLAADVSRNHTRGCPFINAAAEYPDASSHVRRTVAAHREWFRSGLREVLTASGHPDPAGAAGELVLLRDAALVGGYLDGWERVEPAFTASARRAAGLD